MEASEVFLVLCQATCIYGNGFIYPNWCKLSSVQYSLQVSVLIKRVPTAILWFVCNFCRPGDRQHVRGVNWSELISVWFLLQVSVLKRRVIAAILWLMAHIKDIWQHDSWSKMAPIVTSTWTRFLSFHMLGQVWPHMGKILPHLVITFLVWTMT